MLQRSYRVVVWLAACLFVSSAFLFPQTAVFVVRHAEKISETDQRLTEAGHERARRLAKMLGNAGIRAIYTTDTERARDTAGPLSEALKIPITTYDVGGGEQHPVDAAAFAASLRRDHAADAVLVVGHSNTMPAILKALGGREDVTIAASQYDDLFVVVPGASGGATVVKLKY